MNKKELEKLIRKAVRTELNLRDRAILKAVKGESK